MSDSKRWKRWTTGAIRSGALGLSTTLLVLSACARDASNPSALAERFDTLPGGAVRVANPATGVWTEEDAWHLEEEVRIGSLEAEGPELFGQIADIAVADDGTIHVLESQANELRLFGPDGTWLRTIGRPGEGPGELNLRFGGAVLLAPDGLVWIQNTMNRRWDVFGPRGEHVGSVPIFSNSFGSSGVITGTDGAFYQRSQIRNEGAEPRSVVIRLDPRGDSLVPTDTLRVPPMPEGQTVTATLSSGGNRMTMVLPIPFVHQPEWVFSPRGHFWIDPGEGYRLLAVAPGGDTLRIVEREHDPVPVSRAELDEAMEQFTTGLIAQSDAKVDRSQVPDHHPAVDRMRPTASGHLWVRRTLGEDRWAWDVFDPEGIYLGEVRADLDFDRLRIHAITDDAVYGVLTGDLDEPYVVRLGIVEGGGRAGTGG